MEPNPASNINKCPLQITEPPFSPLSPIYIYSTFSLFVSPDIASFIFFILYVGLFIYLLSFNWILVWFSFHACWQQTCMQSLLTYRVFFIHNTYWIIWEIVNCLNITALSGDLTLLMYSVDQQMVSCSFRSEQSVFFAFLMDFSPAATCTPDLGPISSQTICSLLRSWAYAVHIHSLKKHNGHSDMEGTLSSIASGHLCQFAQEMQASHTPLRSKSIFESFACTFWDYGDQ